MPIPEDCITPADISAAFSEMESRESNLEYEVEELRDLVWALERDVTNLEGELEARSEEYCALEEQKDGLFHMLVAAVRLIPDRGEMPWQLGDWYHANRRLVDGGVE